MIQNAALDVAIGLVLMYLMLSLLCTTANEYIASKLKLRAASLASGLQEILDDSGVLQRFYNHGLIAGPNSAVAKTDNLLWHLAKGGGNLQAAVSAAPKGATTAVAGNLPGPATVVPPADHPSYISSINFSLAVLGVLDPAKPIPALVDVQNAVSALPAGSKLKAALQGALTATSIDIDQVRTSLANWFDDSIEQLSGAYKRHLKIISVIVGLVIAILFNADSFEVAHTLWTDPDSRAQVVEMAKTTANKSLDEITKEAQKAQSLRPLPIGWSCSADSNLPICIWKTLTLLKIFGWLLTASALTLGAPFWFDLLQKFINIRGTGVKPARADAKRN